MVQTLTILVLSIFTSLMISLVLPFAFVITCSFTWHMGTRLWPILLTLIIILPGLRWYSAIDERPLSHYTWPLLMVHLWALCILTHSLMLMANYLYPVAFGKWLEDMVSWLSTNDKSLTYGCGFQSKPVTVCNMELHGSCVGKKPGSDTNQSHTTLQHAWVLGS